MREEDRAKARLKQAEACRQRRVSQIESIEMARNRLLH